MAAGLLAFFIALLASLMLVVPVHAPWRYALEWSDLPGRAKFTSANPLLGGLAMYAAVVIAGFSPSNGPARAQMWASSSGATAGRGCWHLDDQGCSIIRSNCLWACHWPAADSVVSGIRGQVFSVLGGRAQAGICWTPSQRSFGWWGYSLVQHPRSHGRLCAASRPCIRFFAMRAYLNGQTAGLPRWLPRFGAASGFFALELQTREDFPGAMAAPCFLGYLMATLGLKLRLENSNHLSAWLAPIRIWACYFRTPRW